MFFLLIQLDLVTQIKNGAIDAHAHIAGAEDGIRDALTRYTTAVSGAYYFVPSVEALRSFASSDDE